MFNKILVANRGEIALRVIRAAREMGMQRSPCIPPRTAMRCMCAWRTKRLHRPAFRHESYLSVPAIISACEITGAEAIHPGYGFLSENADFVQILEDHGLKFIGPTPNISA